MPAGMGQQIWLRSIGGIGEKDDLITHCFYLVGLCNDITELGLTLTVPT